MVEYFISQDVESGPMCTVPGWELLVRVPRSGDMCLHWAPVIPIWLETNHSMWLLNALWTWRLRCGSELHFYCCLWSCVPPVPLVMSYMERVADPSEKTPPEVPEQGNEAIWSKSDRAEPADSSSFLGHCNVNWKDKARKQGVQTKQACLTLPILGILPKLASCVIRPFPLSEHRLTCPRGKAGPCLVLLTPGLRIRPRRVQLVDTLILAQRC